MGEDGAGGAGEGGWSRHGQVVGGEGRPGGTPVGAGNGDLPPGERRGGCPWHRAQLVVAGDWRGLAGGRGAAPLLCPPPAKMGWPRSAGLEGPFLPGIPGGCLEE